MDPASLTLSVLPLLVQALKAYRQVHQKFKIFCNYSKEVKRIQKRIRQQRQVFKSECELLLRSVAQDGCDAVRMLENTADEGWVDVNLERRLCSALKDNLECCMETVEGIAATLEELHLELKVFDELGDHRIEGEPLKDTARRLRGALKITFKKSDYEKLTDVLRDDNNALIQLRGYAQQFAALTSITRPNQQLQNRPKNIAGIRDASQRLHDALTRHETGTLDQDRVLKLCLESQETDHAICLDLVVCSNPPEASITRRQQVPLVSVRQITVETVPVEDAASDNDDTPRNRTSLIGLKRHINCSSAAPSSKARKVRFADDRSSSTITIVSPTVMRPPANSPPINNSICQVLLMRACQPRISTRRCPGLHELVNGSTKHVFHSSAECVMRTCCRAIVPRSAAVVTLYDALQHTVDDAITMVNQFQLARRLVLGVMQYHSTSWLTDRWATTDVAIFSQDSEFSGSSLQTLHYTKRLPSAIARNSDVMEGVELALPSGNNGGPTPTDQLRSEGILNATMYCLGLHLIRIAYWDPMEHLDPPSARKLVEPYAKRPPLGHRYRELARKCLDCDFGFGKDLTNPALQKAMFTGVIGELDELIELFSKLDAC